MLWYILIGLLLWWALWYTMFYYRYDSADQIDDLRSRHRTHQTTLETLQHEAEELHAQNSILKEKTASLMQQNEDYSKLISELSRYYFHIKEATTKVQELGKLLQVFDTDLDKKLTRVWVDTPSLWESMWRVVWQIPVTKHSTSSSTTTQTDKKFF